jgi:hypothetical protein
MTCSLSKVKRCFAFYIRNVNRSAVAAKRSHTLRMAIAGSSMQGRLAFVVYYVWGRSSLEQL